MADFIVAGILLIIIGTAVTYIIRAKKSGAKCIGCPAGGKCPFCHRVKNRTHGFSQLRKVYL